MKTRAETLRSQLIRNFNTAELTPFVRAPRYESRYAGLSDGTAAKKLGCGFDILAPGKQVCPYHLHHAQEEMFVILEGNATLRVAGEMIPITAGDVIFIPPGREYPHHILNTSDQPLKYLSISTQEQPELCEYPDSNKISAWSGETKLRGRTESNLDYWDGEP
jgi:uncharacterized cupin superfamily protein